jgi:hypothetical protein
MMMYRHLGIPISLYMIHISIQTLEVHIHSEALDGQAQSYTVHDMPLARCSIFNLSNEYFGQLTVLASSPSFL